MSVISPFRPQYPLSALMFHRYATVVVGNALTISHDATMDFAHFANQLASANGDTFTHPFYIAAGSYTLKGLGATFNGGGKLDWYIDGVLNVSGLDYYTVGWVSNVVMTAPVTVYGKGQHVLMGKVNGRNGASGAWTIPLTAIYLG